jgi:hypothetical protein
MKNLRSLLFVALAALTPLMSFGAANDIKISQSNSGGTAWIDRIFQPAGGTAVTSVATFRTAFGLGTGDSPTFTAVTLSGATPITLAGGATITAASGGVSIVASGTDQSINITVSGSGQVRMGNVQVFSRTINASGGSLTLTSSDTDVMVITGATGATILGTKVLRFGNTSLATIGVSADTTAGALTFTSPSAGNFTFATGTNINLVNGTSLRAGGSANDRHYLATGIQLFISSSTTILTLTGSDTSAQFAGTVRLNGAGNGVLIAGTGNSRTMALQTTTSGGVATTFLSADATQASTFAHNVTINGTGNDSFLTMNQTGAGGQATLSFQKSGTTRASVGWDQNSATAFFGTTTSTGATEIRSAGVAAISFAANSQNATFAGVIGVAGAAWSGSTAISTPAGTTSASSLRIPHGVAPTSPVNGDMWSTTAGLFIRINGATVGPL